ncbi:MAG: glycosyltransferase, partial [Candidatus Levybacteria bacterium]|nr:glycosyltransferase [Candidatus Levybacteria bacterium]
MNDTFSVIIPALNEEKLLPRLLEELKKQTDKNFEVILVDANSTDRT